MTYTRRENNTAGAGLLGCLGVGGFGCLGVMLALTFWTALIVILATAVFWGMEGFGYDVPNFTPNFPFYF